jgi:Isochorismatase family
MAAQLLCQDLPWHELSDGAAPPQKYDERSGKPVSSEPPGRVSYFLNATLKPDEDKLSRYRKRGGRFILATNVLDVAALSADDALREEKGQQGTERGFRFLKFTGVTTEYCVLGTYRQASDLGLYCLLLEDCWAAFSPTEHEAAIAVILSKNGAIG